jgi:hypothetical protein
MLSDVVVLRWLAVSGGSDAQCRGQVQPVGARPIARGKARLRRRCHGVRTAHPAADRVGDAGAHAIVVGRLDIIVHHRTRTRGNSGCSVSA